MKKMIMLSVAVLVIIPFDAFSWQRHSIGSIEYPIYIIVADLDDDGDMDVASGNQMSADPINSEVAWFENDFDNSSTFIKRVISPAAPDAAAIQNSEGLTVSDVDNDGRRDVAVATGTMVNQYGGLYWFEAPSGFRGDWIRHSIYEPTDGNSFFKVYAIDPNEDGWPDFVAGGDSGAYVFFNPGSPATPDTSWEYLLLDDYSGPSVNLADVDNDGTVDILNTNTAVVPPETVGNVSWFKLINDDGVVRVERTVIDAELRRAFDIVAMDITGDGFPEVFVSIFSPPPGDPDLNGVYWYENPGLEGGAWKKNVVDPDFSASDLYVADINGDGQDDLLAAGLFIRKISWFEYKERGGRTVWQEHVVDPDVALPGDVSANDIDGDGDTDIVAAVLSDDEVVWYENTGTPAGCFFEAVLGDDRESLDLLRKFRDNSLNKSMLGRSLIKVYSQLSPWAIEAMGNSPRLKEISRKIVITVLPFR